jgi:hypothetical protein
MSWSVSCSGSLAVVKKSVRSQFKSQAVHYVGTEEGRLLEMARKLVVRHLKTHPKQLDVGVSANGSASGYGWDNTTGKYAGATQSVAVSVTVIHKPAA